MLKWYNVCIRTRVGIYGQIYPSAFRSSQGLRPWELLQAEGYIWRYIPPLVLIRIQYHLPKWQKIRWNIWKLNFFFEYWLLYFNNLIPLSVLFASCWVQIPSLQIWRNTVSLANIKLHCLSGKYEVTLSVSWIWSNTVSLANVDIANFNKITWPWWFF